MGSGAGAGLIGARSLITLVVVLVVSGAVIEDATHQAHAGGTVHQTLCRAEPLLVAHPAGGQRAWQCAFAAATPATAFAQQHVLLLCWRRREEWQWEWHPLLAGGYLCSFIGIGVLREGRSGSGRGGRGEDFGFSGEKAGGGDDLGGGGGEAARRVVVHSGGRHSVVQQPLIGAGAATAAGRTRTAAKGDPGVGGGILMGVGGAFAPGLLLVVVVVVAPSIECLLAVVQPGASLAGPFVAGGLLGHNQRAVDVVVLQVG